MPPPTSTTRTRVRCGVQESSEAEYEIHAVVRQLQTLRERLLMPARS